MQLYKKKDNFNGVNDIFDFNVSDAMFQKLSIPVCKHFGLVSERTGINILHLIILTGWE